MRRRWRYPIWGLGLALSAAVVVILAQDSRPFTQPEIAIRAQALFRYGAVEVPHGLLPKGDPMAPLFAQVALGAALDSAQSAAYRARFQQVLFAYQPLFRALDDDLHLAQDAGMTMGNNIGTMGIAGRHDLHAASAKANFTELAQGLAALPHAGAVRKILLANQSYKDLTDLMVHLAPAVHSVDLTDNPALPDLDPALSRPFDTFRTALKRAEFAPVGSADYRNAIAEGVTAYAGLVGEVQRQITANLTPLEQKLAGRWLSLQSVSPQLTLP